MNKTPVVLIMMLVTPAYASNEYMQVIKRDASFAQGSSQEIAKKAVSCIAKTSEMEGSPFIDLEGGLVVATATVNGRKFNLGGPQQVIKTKLTVETRESKFRITRDNIMVSYISIYDGKYEFKPVKANSEASKDVATFLAAADEKLAACIAAKAEDF